MEMKMLSTALALTWVACKYLNLDSKISVRKIDQIIQTSKHRSFIDRIKQSDVNYLLSLPSQLTF